MPRVSIIIPTYNTAHFLGRAISSTLSQTYNDYEVIVVDDGSTDETVKVVERFENKVRYFYQPNRGAASARNLALSKANGELIAYLDSDDMWRPHKLERQVRFLDAHPKYALVHSDVSVIDENDLEIHQRFNRETMRSVPEGNCLEQLLRDSHIQTLTVIERREFLEKIGTFDERLKITHDYSRWILAAMNGLSLGYIDEPLAQYRWRAGSISSSHRGMCEDLVMMYEILLGEKSLPQRYGQEKATIVQEKIYRLRRDLAYLDRSEGQAKAARQKVINLIRGWPLRAELYVDLIKTCIPLLLATKLGLMKEQWAILEMPRRRRF